MARRECGAYLTVHGFGGGQVRVYCERGSLWDGDHERHLWSDGVDATIQWTDSAVGAGRISNGDV